MKGFTLVETLVAITVVLLAVMGPFQVVKDALTASYVARDQLVATALAEEALEYVRSIRDNNYLYNVANPSTPRNWFHGLNGTGGPDCFAVTGCAVDPLQDTRVGCGGTCPTLTTTATGIYTQQIGVGFTPTRFVRTVRLTQVVPNREVRVQVTVTFYTRSQPYTVTVTDNLYNWL